MWTGHAEGKLCNQSVLTLQSWPALPVFWIQVLTFTRLSSAGCLGGRPDQF